MPSIGSLGDAHVHAMPERFFATLERELSNPRRFKSQVESKTVVFEWRGCIKVGGALSQTG
jgi:hypothetical protein